MQTNSLEFLNSQLVQVEAQIAPLEVIKNALKIQIEALQTAEKLAAYGLTLGDAVRSTPEFIDYCRIKPYETEVAKGRLLYISGLNFDQVVLSMRPEGGGVAYAATLEMAQRMKVEPLYKRGQG